MHGSIRELIRFRLRSRIYSPLVIIGIVAVTFGIIMGIVKPDPLTMGAHLVVFSSGAALILIGMILYQNEEIFAQKYDMTHILDIDDRAERYQAYMEHLSEWIASDLEEINPVRTRGIDPAGPDWGKTDFKLGHEPKRRDAIIEGKKYTGMEGDLTSGEMMVADANMKYATMAQKRWEEAEANDPDLIEYGVEKLGDLVRTDYFEKNAEDGVFSKTANPDQDAQ